MSTTSETNHSTLPFFLLAYLITWACWIPFAMFGPSSSALAADSALRASPFMLLQVIGNFGPTLAAVVIWIFSGKHGQLRDALSRLLPRRAKFVWYVVALLLPLAMLLPGLLTYMLLGGSTANFSIVTLLLMCIPALVISGIGEEMGWRGYALTRLQKARSPFVSSVIVGVFWGVWHLPIIYWFSAQTGLLFVGEFMLYVLLITAGSVVFAWVYDMTNQSLWMVVLMHATFTASGNTIASFTHPVTGGSWAPYIVNVLSVIGVAGLVVGLNKTRMLARPTAA